MTTPKGRTRKIILAYGDDACKIPPQHPYEKFSGDNPRETQPQNFFTKTVLGKWMTSAAFQIITSKYFRGCETVFIN
jgi:hypothetical protein